MNVFKYFLKLIILFSIIVYFSQDILSQTASIKGIVKEKGSSELITGANVIITGTTTGSSTDFDGKFEIMGLNPGIYNIEVSFISYSKKSIDSIRVISNKATELFIELEPISQNLEVVNIISTALRDRENFLLMEQKKATGLVQHIGTQELERKGIGDVATAVTKVTGISKTEGNNNIYVRGLGDRYNSTQMNGLPMPSNNPEQKNVSLDLFSTDIVEFISIDKVYNNYIYGDFAGGNVDIISKNFAGTPYINIGFGAGANTTIIDEDVFPVKQGPNFFGLWTTTPPKSIEYYEFENMWESNSMSPLNTNFSFSAANKSTLNKLSELSYFVTLNFGNNFTSTEGIARSVNSSGIPTKDLRMKTYDYNTNTTGMMNINYTFKTHNKINYNFVYINSSKNATGIYEGTFIDIANDDNGLLTRKTYEKNTILINQFLGRHSFGKQSDVSWGLSYNTTSSDMPDRIQNTFVRIADGNYLFGQNQITDNHRYFHYLDENELAANLAFSYKFKSQKYDDYRLKLTLGGTTRYKVRNFEATQYNFRIHTDQRQTIIDPEHLSDFFNQENLAKGNYFRIETFRGNYQVPFALDPQVYDGTQIIEAAFLTTEYKLTKKITTLLGLRGEMIYQEVGWNTQLDPSDKTDAFDIIEFLPSLSTKYEINDKQNLRFGTSKTYTLPQFKERALFIYEEVTQVKLGNPALYPSQNYNADLKWELFPNLGEIISLGSFGKYILNPINEVTISSATNDISFLNTGDWGYVAGLEFEARKELFKIKNSKFLVGYNTTYMHTEQELNSEKVKEETIYMVNFTDEKARFTGASDWLINADITYIYNWNENKNDVMATISYAYMSNKIYALGTNTRGNIIDKGYNSMDVILKAKLNKLNIGLNFKNILNPNLESYQANINDDIVVLSYKKGINMGFSLSYKF